MMTRELVRGFLVRQLTDDQITIVREAESKLPSPTMCLENSQIQKLLGLELTGISLEPSQMEAMQRCWNDFYKSILGPQQAHEDNLHPKGCTMFTCRHPWDNRCKTKYQEMWQWEDYALNHYKPPQTKTSGVEAILSSVVVALTLLR
jgi:hypothetical protein